ncbi:MAG: hypothetical protein AAGI48_13245 [Verrucomicrobiota bacterium]
MHALRIELGDLTKVISLKNQGVLSAIVNCTDFPAPRNARVELSMGGLDSEGDEHFRWDSLELKSGDSVTITLVPFVEGEQPDEVTTTPQFREMRIEDLRKSAKNLGFRLEPLESDNR